MYKIMIVDDDELVRERVISLIPIDKLGLELCGQADNGVHALEVFQLNRPQIVIMDIQIPLMDGIEVARRMLDIQPETKIITITGYGSVEYAKAAIQNGVTGFLLKPINPNELQEILSKCITKIDHEISESLEKQRMERLLRKEMPAIRSRYFMSLLQSDPGDLTDAACIQYLNDFGITAPVTDVCVIIIVPNFNNLPVDQQVSMQSILEDELSKCLGNTCEALTLYDSMRRMLVIAYGTQKNFDYILEEKLSVTRDKLKYLYRFDFRASIGISVSGFRFLSISYDSARKALDYWSILGNNNIVNSSNIQQLERPAPHVDSIKYSEILDILITEDMNRLKTELDDYINKLAYNSQNSLSYIQQKTVELLALIVSCAQELGIQTDDILCSNGSIYARIFSAISVLSVVEIITSTTQQIINDIHKKRKDSKHRSLGSAKRYIFENYAKFDLSLSEVSEHVKLSPNYLAQLFRRYENCSFTEYVNKIKIEQAQRLLSSSHMRVYEVAEAVGFQNSKYFFQVFKQITGMRPREFYSKSVTELGNESGNN